MQLTNELRVRPVTRFLLTHHQCEIDPPPSDENPLGQDRSTTREIGEFKSAQAATDVALAMMNGIQGASLATAYGDAPQPSKYMAVALEPERFCDYVIVAVKTFEIMAPVYHAQSRKEAEARRATAALEHNTEFEIFERPITDPVRLAQRRAGM